MSVVRTVAALLCVIALSTAARAATLPTGFAETRVATGMPSPTAMAIAPDGRIFVAQQGGALRVVKNGALLSQPFLTVSVNSSGERGLLGIAFDPELRHQQFRLRVLHDLGVAHSQPREPLHGECRESGRGGRGQRSADAESAEPELGDQPQRRRHSLRHGRQALHRGRRERQRRQCAIAEHHAGQDSAHQLRRHDSLRQSVHQPDHRHEPGDLGARPAQSVHVRDRPARTAASTSTMWARSPGKRSISGVAGSNYGWPQTEGNNPSGVAGVRYPIHTYQSHGRRLRDHRWRVLSAHHRHVSRRNMPGAISSAISAPDSFAC